MDDSSNKDKKSTHEANLAKIAKVKPRRKKRNSNIYEKFLNRVQTDISNEKGKANNLQPLKNKKNRAAYEPNDDNNLQSFTFKDLELVIEDDEEQTQTSEHISADSEGSDSDTPTSKPHIDNLNNPIDSDKASFASAQEIIESDETRIEANSDSASISNEPPDLTVDQGIPKTVEKKNSKKPLIIGVIVGTLISVVVVAVLAFTGVLSTSDSNSVSDNTDEDTAVIVTPSDSTSNVNNANTVSDTINIPNEAEVPVVTVDENSASNENATPAETTTPKPVEEVTESNPSITLDDFKEESQNTLYRETND